ncbi:hypothetical protein C0991_006789 [Blastosporella zonata]|nr:hypothetical protein C0991_006789 [Blastosporella zonata]
MQMTGQPFMQAQPTGFIQPQQTAFQTNPFSMEQPQSGHGAFASFRPQPTQPQPTGFPQPQQPQPTGFGQAQQLQSTSFASLQIPQQTGFLQPQATGANPFRQSMLFPQSTGMQLFAGAGSAATLGQANQNPFPNQNQNQGHGTQGVNLSQPFTSTGMAFSASSPLASPFTQTPSSGQPSNLPARPSSTPLTSFGSSSNTATSPPVAQPVKTHQTGTKNPFGPIAPAAPPPVPKQPTLMELSMGFSGVNVPQQQQKPQQPAQQHQSPIQSGFNAFNSGALSAGSTDISSVASSFAFNNKANGTTTPSSPSGFQPSGALNAQPTAASTVSSAFSDSMWSSSLSSQPTGATNTSSPSAPIKPQMTGFAGLKPFKPSSSFGASLLESLPPIPGSSSGTPAPTINTNATGAAPTNNGVSSFASFSPSSRPFVGTQMTGNFGSGSTLGVGLRPQMTGGGAANPFRASMMGNGNATSSPPPVPGLPSLALGSQTFGSNLFNGTSGTFGSNSPFGQNSQHQQQNSSSLI